MSTETLSAVWIPRITGLSIAAVRSVDHDPEKIIEAGLVFESSPSRVTLQNLAKAYRSVASSLLTTVQKARRRKARTVVSEAIGCHGEARAEADKFAFSAAFGRSSQDQMLANLDRIMDGLRGVSRAQAMADKIIETIGSGPVDTDDPDTALVARVWIAINNMGRSNGWITKIEQQWPRSNWDIPKGWMETSDHIILMDIIDPCLQMIAGSIEGYTHVEINPQPKNAWDLALEQATPEPM